MHQPDILHLARNRRLGTEQNDERPYVYARTTNETTRSDRLSTAEPMSSGRSDSIRVQLSTMTAGGAVAAPENDLPSGGWGAPRLRYRAFVPGDLARDRPAAGHFAAPTDKYIRRGIPIAAIDRP